MELLVDAVHDFYLRTTEFLVICCHLVTIARELHRRFTLRSPHPREPPTDGSKWPLLNQPQERSYSTAMKALILQFLASLADSFRDLVPIIAVIAFFQLIVLGQPIPNLLDMLWGMFLVLIGLTLFVQGLKLGLFPIGESLAWDFAAKGSLIWLLIFAFALGFGTTVAEPALIAVANEAANVAAVGGWISDDPAAREDYADGLRITVALSVGAAIVIGVLRILKGFPIQNLIIIGYIGVVVMTFFAPPEIIGIAYDSGGVTTSTITVPLVAALGVGLASSIEGRNPMIDGFGLIAFASLTPMIFVMGYGALL